MITASALPRAVPVVAAAYLSPRARALLRDRGVGYVDTTGNVRIEISTPGLFISTAGADRDPWPRDHKLRSLRGRGAARAMRAIIDTSPPYGVRELAQSTGASAPTLSRVLDLLKREAIVTRARGAVSTVDWQGAIAGGPRTTTRPIPTHQPRFLSHGVCRPSKKAPREELRVRRHRRSCSSAIRSHRSGTTGGRLRHRRPKVHRPLGSPRDRNRRQRGASRASRSCRLRSDGRARWPSLRRSQPTRRGPADRTGSGAVTGRTDVEVDGEERACLAVLIRCTFAPALRCSTPPMRWPNSSTPSCSSVLRPSISTPAMPTSLPPSTRPTQTSASRRRICATRRS